MRTLLRNELKAIKGGDRSEFPAGYYECYCQGNTGPGHMSWPDFSGTYTNPFALFGDIEANCPDPTNAVCVAR